MSTAHHKRARKAVAAIIEDLSDRRGLKSEWRAIDPETRAQIKKAWIALIVAAFSSDAEPTEPHPG